MLRTCWCLMPVNTPLRFFTDRSSRCNLCRASPDTAGTFDTCRVPAVCSCAAPASPLATAFSHYYPYNHRPCRYRTHRAGTWTSRTSRSTPRTALAVQGVKPHLGFSLRYRPQPYSPRQLLDDVTLLFAHYTAPPYRSYASPWLLPPPSGRPVAHGLPPYSPC